MDGYLVPTVLFFFSSKLLWVCLLMHMRERCFGRQLSSGFLKLLPITLQSMCVCVGGGEVSVSVLWGLFGPGFFLAVAAG